MKFRNVQLSSSNIETIIEVISKVLSQRMPSQVVRKYTSKLLCIIEAGKFYESKVEIYRNIIVSIRSNRNCWTTLYHGLHGA